MERKCGKDLVETNVKNGLTKQMSESIYSGKDAVVNFVPIEPKSSIQVDDGKFSCKWKKEWDKILE